MSEIKDVSAIISHIWSPSQADKRLVKKAYRIAKDAHNGQTRYSGAAYVTHPIEAAIILAKLQMDTKTIAAGLMHDVIEDTDTPKELIEDEFDPEVLFLIQGVTKLGKVRFEGMKRHIESLRKLFVATSQDIRVLIIKLADRLHNMRTLEYVPERKQGRIAEETLRVYAPIAHRLGIGKINTKLEDQAFPYVYPEKHEKTKEISEDKYEEAVRTIEKIRKKLVRLLKADENVRVTEINYRLKGLFSLYKKLERKDWNIDEIYDIVALRVVVESVDECYQALGIINSQWQPLTGRLKDYIASPKPNNYQSLHTTVFSGDGNIAEIQIRTGAMHQAAEFGVASHANYKSEGEGGYLSWFDDFLQKMNARQAADTKSEDGQRAPDWIERLSELQADTTEPAEFMKNLETDFLEDRIFVFTPDGEVVDLPRGASPIDFAYQIHTEIGHHTTGCKINEKLSSLDTSLENGDIVEIITDESREPSKKWLEFVKTTDAKRKIAKAVAAETE